MLKWQEIAITIAVGAAIPAVGGLIWLGKLENRLEQLEARAQNLEANPIRSKCAELAGYFASGQAYNPNGQASRIDLNKEPPNLLEAMNALGCNRTN